MLVCWVCVNVNVGGLICDLLYVVLRCGVIVFGICVLSCVSLRLVAALLV